MCSPHRATAQSRSSSALGPDQLPSHLEASPVPGCVPVRWPLQVSELDLVGSICAPDLHRELHLQELVSLLPLNLNVAAEGRHHGGLTGTDCTSRVLVCSSQSTSATTQTHQSLNMDELVGPSSTLVPWDPYPWAAFCRGGQAAGDSREGTREGGYNSGTRFSSPVPSCMEC